PRRRLHRPDPPPASHLRRRGGRARAPARLCRADVPVRGARRIVRHLQVSFLLTCPMWWFRRKSSPPSEPASAPPKGTVAALPAAPTEAIPFVFDVAIRSDRGVQRPHNEDQG